MVELLAKISRTMPATLILFGAVLMGGLARADENLLEYVGTEGDASGTITLSVEPGGNRLVPLYAPTSTRQLQELVLELTSFTGPDGEQLKVTPSLNVEGLPDWKPDATKYVLAPTTQLKAEILPLKLTVGDLAPTVNYKGNLLN